MWFINRITDVFRIIYEEGEKEWLDEEKYKEMLKELYVKLENEEIGEEEYEELEKEILDKLGEIRRYKREHEIKGDQ
jgi:hypothetical protein